MVVLFAIGLYAVPEALGQQVCCLEVETGNSLYGDGSSIQLKFELEGIATSEWLRNNPVEWQITNYYIPSNSTFPGGHNVVAEGTTVLVQNSNNVLRSSTSVNSAGWGWTGPYTITASIDNYEKTNYFNLWNRNLPIPSVPIAESNADTSGMCCIDVNIGNRNSFVWAYEEGYGSSTWTSVRVSFVLEGYATSEWRENNNAIVQIFDPDQELIATGEAKLGTPNSYNIMKSNYIFESGTITPLKSGQYIASVTLGSLQGTAPFYFDSDCVAYCDGTTSRILKETSEVIPEPEVIPETEVIEESVENVPPWVRNVFIWYAEDRISEPELLEAIKFLVNQGIIDLNN